MQSIELTGQRCLAFAANNRLRKFALSPITRDMWMKYFDSIVSTSENRGREQFNTFDSTSPLLALVGEALVDADGYVLPDTREKLTDVPEWKTKIPFAHRLAIGQILTNVSPVVDESGEEGVLGLDTVTLEAMWNSDGEGRMPLTRPLVHRFTTPQFKHEQRYMREQSRSKVVGGSRSGKTVWMGVQRVLVDLYDELVVSVEGYTLNGEPVSPAQITACMDTYHKVVAAQQLFRVPPQVEPEEQSA